MMYDGWPAQEGGTDSGRHPRRDSHDALQPAERSASGIYPAWWPVDEEEPEPRPKTAPGSTSAPAAAPETTVAAEKAPVTKDASTETVAPAKPSTGTSTQATAPADAKAHGGKQPAETSNKQTQTARGSEPRLRKLRQPLMPCMKAPPQQNVSRKPPTRSRVAAELKREAVLRSQLEAARRHRLQAMVARVPITVDEPTASDVLSITQNFLAGGLATPFADLEADRLGATSIAHAELYAPVDSYAPVASSAPRAPEPPPAAETQSAANPPPAAESPSTTEPPPAAESLTATEPPPAAEAPSPAEPPRAAEAQSAPESSSTAETDPPVTTPVPPPPPLRANLPRKEPEAPEDPTQWLGDFSAQFKGSL